MRRTRATKIRTPITKEARCGPDVFAGLGGQALGEWFDGLVDEFEGGQRRVARVAGKDVVLDFGAEAGGLHAHLEAFGVGFVAHEDGVDGFYEGGHAVVAFGAGTVEPSDVAVGAGGVCRGAWGGVGRCFFW